MREALPSSLEILAKLGREPDNEKMRKKIDDWRGKALSKATSHIDMWSPKRK